MRWEATVFLVGLLVLNMQEMEVLFSRIYSFVCKHQEEKGCIAEISSKSLPSDIFLAFHILLACLLIWHILRWWLMSRSTHCKSSAEESLPQSVSISNWPSSHTIMSHGLFYLSIDKLDLFSSEPIQPAVRLLARGMWICDGRDNTWVFVWVFWADAELCDWNTIGGTIFDLSTLRKSPGLDEFSYIIVVPILLIAHLIPLGCVNHLFQTSSAGLSCFTVDPSALEQDYETIPRWHWLCCPVMPPSFQLHPLWLILPAFSLGRNWSSYH